RRAGPVVAAVGALQLGVAGEEVGVVVHAFPGRVVPTFLAAWHDTPFREGPFLDGSYVGRYVDEDPVHEVDPGQVGRDRLALDVDVVANGRNVGVDAEKRERAGVLRHVVPTEGWIAVLREHDVLVGIRNGEGVLPGDALAVGEVGAGELHAPTLLRLR